MPAGFRDGDKVMSLGRNVREEDMRVPIDTGTGMEMRLKQVGLLYSWGCERGFELKDRRER